ncbi:MAG TPA: ribosomal protein S18-alanine N-acetyltransferase [Patescibacteria group bacterium]|nr:ribosomal protein S18-alanine N-acetyltransferase [Patescibacteria group bacterium]
MARPLKCHAPVRRLEPRDLEAVLAIEAEAHPWAAQWTPDSYLPSEDSTMRAWVTERAGRVAGFVLARYAGGEMEVLNLAVAESARRTGAGAALVAAALTEGEARGAVQAFLEVRQSNAAALAFYAALGFSVSGRRDRYYQHPEEDALILAIPLPRRG